VKVCRPIPALFVVGLAACSGGSDGVGRPLGSDFVDTVTPAASISTPTTNAGTSPTTSEIPLRSSALPPVLVSRGQLPGQTEAEIVDHPGYFYNLVSPDGSLAGFPASTGEGDQCPWPLSIRSSSGAVTRTTIKTKGRCVMGFDGNSMNDRWIAFIDAPTPELTFQTGWKLTTFDRRSETTWDVTEPGRAAVPFFLPSLDDDHVAWHELAVTPGHPGGYPTSFVANLQTHDIVLAGEGLVDPVVRWPFVFATAYDLDLANPRFVRVDLESGGRVDLGEGPVLLAASDDYLVASLQDGSWLMDFDGNRLARLPAVASYTVAGDFLFAWQTFPDGEHVRRQVLDTRCLALYDVGEEVTQGVGIMASGTRLLWGTWGETHSAESTILRLLDTSNLDLCAR
jgi:hypothetical protein